MRPRKTILLPKALKSLAILGQNLKLARIRRRIPAALMCERAGLSHLSQSVQGHGEGRFQRCARP